MKSPGLIALAAVTALGVTGLVAPLAAPEPAVAASAVTITPNPAYASEAFEGWGTSLVWFANATGGYPEQVRQDLLEKVFGEDGLNLNIARYNIGGGNATDVPSYLRPGGAVDGWWNPDLNASDASGPITSTYADRARYAAAWNPDDPDAFDWNADATQRWWIEALKDKITKWEAFSNSPPYFLTQSGYVSGGINNATSEQLAPADMDKFAGYLVKVVEHLEETYGIQFDSLDPFNEPNTNYWGTTIPQGATWPSSASRQEGAHIGPQRQDQMIQALAARLAAPGTTTDVPISAMDETNPSTFVTNWNGWSQTSRDEVSQLNVHTYGTSNRTMVRDIAKTSDKPLWMSEVEGNWDSSNAGFNQTNIDNGLGMAGHMIDDLRELEPRAWVFWQPVEDLYNMQKVEKTNWGSVFIDFDCNAQNQSARRLADGDADASCKVLTNAKYNTIRNFTHYIRPGDHIVPTNDTQTTAAVTAAGDGVNLVHVNTEASARTVRLDLSNFGQIAPGAKVTPIVTTQSPADAVEQNALVRGSDVAIDPLTRTATLTVPAKSVTTFVVSGVSGVAAAAPAVKDGATYQLLGTQSGKALTVQNAALTIRSSATTADAATAQTWTAVSLSGAGTDRQRVLLRSGDGRYLASSGTSLTLATESAEQAAADPAAQWVPNTLDGRSYSFLNVASTRVLDVNGGGTSDGTSVGLWTSNNGANQSWTLAPTAIDTVADVTVTTEAGVAPTLPGTVQVRYLGGLTRTAAVTWDLSGHDWSAGTTEVAGSGTDLFGAPFTARALVDVGAFTAAVPVSLTTYAGTTLDAVSAAAPPTVPLEVRTGGATVAAPVTWSWDAVTDAELAAPGTVRVPGTAAVPGGGTLDAVLTVIVTTPTEKNVAPTSTPTATYTESGYPATRTINGVTTDKGWSNWRGGTLNASDTLTYALSAPTPVTHVMVYFKRDGGTSWAQTMHIDHRLGTGEWVIGDTITVGTPATGDPQVDVPVDAASADQVRVVMNAYPNTHLIVSEVEIYAPAASPSEVADLARLTVGSASVKDFSADTTAYEVAVAGSAWPVVAATAVDQDASVRVVQPGDGQGTATVTVTAPSGAQKSYTVTVARAAVLSGVTIGGTPTVGAALSAVPGTVDPATADLAYVWKRDGVAIDGADGAQYTVTTDDVGHELTVVATVTAPGFTAGTATSDAVTGQPGTATPTPTPTPTSTATPTPTPTATPEPTGSPTASPSPSATATSAPGTSTPTEADLTTALEGRISGPASIAAGSTVSVQVGADRAGQQVAAWLFSTPRALGAATVSAAGTIPVTVPLDAVAGAHRLAVTDAAGTVIGWYAVTVTAPPTTLATTGATAPFALALTVAVLLLIAGAALVRRRRPARG
ncbi:RICIN domain-containing protein [Microbacterium hominis]|uniref:RICIN domain-containing protein n=1 Tax=Microbacterium TaxID=33882 RepID=UPI00168B5A91|nr:MULTISPECIES: glycoside hydrolase [Microbacterium]QOC27273.1 RICIN domain-containing protein [Microbacterium hominis]QOC28415.1 RICIN domain-containing protein [Microbacterium hominis]QYF96390.1 RICIN domain-containing protein [Microbacterium sp. PAMC21962]